MAAVSGAAFTADMVVSIRAITDMAIPVLLLLLLIAYSLRSETAQPGLAWTPDAARWLASAEAE
jgi:hypothetical protein